MTRNKLNLDGKYQADQSANGKDGLYGSILHASLHSIVKEHIKEALENKTIFRSGSGNEFLNLQKHIHIV